MIVRYPLPSGGIKLIAEMTREELIEVVQDMSGQLEAVMRNNERLRGSTGRRGGRVALAGMAVLAITLALMEFAGPPNALPVPKFCRDSPRAFHVCPVMPDRLPAHAVNPKD